MARVACPHRVISTVGVNQRSRKRVAVLKEPSLGSGKAVSDTLNSAASCCFTLSAIGYNCSG